MINARLHYLLGCCTTEDGQRLTVGRLAAAIGSARPHVNEVLNNKPTHGHRTRRKLAAWLLEHHHKYAYEIFHELGWDSTGQKVPHGESQTRGYDRPKLNRTILQHLPKRGQSPVLTQ